MGREQELERRGTALDLLEREDAEIRTMFEQLAQTSGAAVEDRSDHGVLAKQLVRHVATRESALSDVVEAISEIPQLTELSDRMDQRTEDRRSLITDMERMSRGIQGMYLNTGQDFDGAVASLEDLLMQEIEWELSTAIPIIRARTDEGTRQDVFHSAEYAIRHAPTNLSPNGRRWYEKAPVVSRIITIYDHLRDFPRAASPQRD